MDDDDDDQGLLGAAGVGRYDQEDLLAALLDEEILPASVSGGGGCGQICR